MVDYSELHERKAKYMPTPKQIAAECAKIRAENEAAKQGKRFQPPVDDDCDADLEAAADEECSL